MENLGGYLWVVVGRGGVGGRLLCGVYIQISIKINVFEI